MFAKTNRLTKDKEFDNVFDPPTGGGKASYDKILGLKVAKNNLAKNRFGVVVSNKISKKAVERNRIKRQIRGAVEKNMPNMKAGYDCVIIAQPGITESNYQEIRKSVESHLKKLKIL